MLPTIRRLIRQSLHLSWFCSVASDLVEVEADEPSVERRSGRSRTDHAWPPLDETTGRTIAPAARTAMPVLQLGHWIDAKRRERAYKRQDKKSALGTKTLARQTRMNQYSPNALSRLMLTPAVRDLAALHDYSEGSHEANARQCNSGRGVARRPR